MSQGEIRQIEQDLDASIGRRTGRPVRPSLITLASSEDAALLPPGTLGIFVGLSESTELASLKDAGGNLGSTLERLEAEINERLMSDEPVYASFDELPAVVEVTYGDKRLAKGLFVGSEFPVAVACVLYSGGQLDENRFGAVAYELPSESVGVEVVVIANPPELSDREARVIAAVPGDATEVLLSSIPRVVPAVAATIVAREGARRGALWAAEAAGAAGIGWAVGKGLDAGWNRLVGGSRRMEEETAPVDHVDPTAFAEELLARRIAALKATPPPRSDE